MSSVNIRPAKAFVMFAIEKTLFDSGEYDLEEFISLLHKKFQCGILDCYERPEYVVAALKKMYAQRYVEKIKQIKTNLSEFGPKETINKFIEALDS